MKSRIVLGTLAAVLIAAPISPATPFWRTDDGEGAAARIEGRVRDAASGLGIGGAQVSVAGTVIGTLTDARGRYALEGVPSGRSITVTVRLIGYSEMSRRVEVGEGETLTIDFELEQATVALQEIVVAGDESAAPLPATGPSGARMLRASAGYAGAVKADPEFNTESYARVDENPWKAPARDPLSTFSIDVDRASYSNIRRFISNGVRPPVDAVRIEEMVNYFPYDYPDPDGEHPFGISTEIARRRGTRRTTSCESGSRASGSISRTCRPRTSSSCSTCPGRCSRRTSSRCSSGRCGCS